MAWGEPFDSPLWHQRADGLAFVCHDHACQLPAENVTDLAAQLL